MDSGARGDSMRRGKKLSPLVTREKRLYLINQIVIVQSEVLWFNLVKVRYENDLREFLVDVRLLALEPDDTRTISLGLLGGI